LCCRCLITLTLALEETVEAVEGRNVLLPCLYSGDIPKSKEVDVAWRYNDDKNVHDIIEGNVYVDNQDPVFKNRTESFPDAYGKGNFSIRLSRVSGSDNGTYSCLLTFASDTLYIKLHVKVRPPDQHQAPSSEWLTLSPILPVVHVLFPEPPTGDM
uniref:Ig-like domain-containing protein n=1 Tax=Pygocentrus nattereri TaxID=42514 RepID=A0AAR2JLR2_PYGNA